MSDNLTAVRPILSYTDARAAVAFLVEAFGFEERCVYARDGDPSVIEHGELRWPLGGGVMFGTAGKDDSAFGRRAPGNDAVYVVCEDPDALFERATARGAEVVRPSRTRTTALAASASATPRATTGASAPIGVSRPS